MLALRGVIDGVEHTVVLDRTETSLGRATDNDVVLTDRVTSAHHAVIRRDGERWRIRDLDSRYGLLVNGLVADEVDLEAGDSVTIGTVTFSVDATAVADGPTAGDDPDEGEPPDAALEPPPPALVRSIEDFATSLGFDPAGVAGLPPTVPEAVAPAPTAAADDDHAFSALAVGHLTRLARELRSAADEDEAARRTLDAAFAALPVDRGWVLLADEDGELRHRVARIRDRIEHPEGTLPISWSIVRRVLAERTALGTGDVTLDPVKASRSMMAHHIRAALCAPLWADDEVVGVIYVDSLLTTGNFTEAALDLLTAMANNLAITTRGLRHAQEAEREREARRHLERYHSPAMIDALAAEPGADGPA
ncbi:MAG TPA: FHA domain-containing protein, partial [Acidimicrobiales bacterium]|nr:FHA domain-containing protein [Acidimicrobiales bacterium]